MDSRSEHITLIKEWCDKKGHDQPTYVYTGTDTSWVCIADIFGKKVYSEQCTSKKLAKQNAAEKLWLDLSRTGVTLNHGPQGETGPQGEISHYSLSKHIAVLIDGDQRIDCWSISVR